MASCYNSWPSSHFLRWAQSSVVKHGKQKNVLSSFSLWFFYILLEIKKKHHITDYLQKCSKCLVICVNISMWMLSDGCYWLSFVDRKSVVQKVKSLLEYCVVEKHMSQQKYSKQCFPHCTAIGCGWFIIIWGRHTRITIKTALQFATQIYMKSRVSCIMISILLFTFVFSDRFLSFFSLDITNR